MKPDDLKKLLCSSFCSGIDVQAVPSGLAVSTVFSDASGDNLDFYIVDVGNDSFRIEDDGSYLAHLVAKDIPIEDGQRGHLLQSILEQGKAYKDVETLEIKTDHFHSSELASRAISFLSSLIRVRDLELFTRSFVKSTFKEDAFSAIQSRIGNVANLEKDSSASKELSEFPADLIITPNSSDGRKGVIYFVNSNERLNEALLLQLEALNLGIKSIEVVALLEALNSVSPSRFQRAQNRSLAMPIFRGDEDAAISMIGRRLQLPVQAA